MYLLVIVLTGVIGEMIWSFPPLFSGEIRSAFFLVADADDGVENAGAHELGELPVLLSGFEQHADFCVASC